MKTIVLITRENSEKTTNVSVFLCDSYSDAKHFCHFVKRLSLAGEDKLFARRITVNAEYSLEKYQAFGFDDFVKLNDRTIQRAMREMDSQILAIALMDAKKEVKDIFFRNMSKRAAAMLQEDMEYVGPVTESDIESARQYTLNVYDDLIIENRFDEAWVKYRKMKENEIKNQDDSNGETSIGLVFRGAGNTADFVSVYLFDEYSSADQFCHYLNSLEPDKGSFFYARHIDQMTEYETTKPLLISFDQIFDLNRVCGEYNGAFIIREALKKFSSTAILQAVKGLDKRSRMLLMQSLPTKSTDEINESIEKSDKYNTDLTSLNYTRKAQQRIIDAVNKIACKFRRGEYTQDVVIEA